MVNQTVYGYTPGAHVPTAGMQRANYSNPTGLKQMPWKQVPPGHIGSNLGAGARTNAGGNAGATPSMIRNRPPGIAKKQTARRCTCRPAKRKSPGRARR
jgi:hypothetical protein